ncbi:4-hydroxy-tetrahydrodipicolinate reductase [Aerococcus urinaehominis]|uniref:4-hydroxy-tetrahydrodipicolinate reductase n=1 Tax=Aerococcus urinaehominis TaxID=128944 RepID=A0A0X8FM17_9LACT|nr:4-hydroxy-tetrahydrodipicolinate reductase [Aerococcus urinaehominis]AMB99717.1 4-hydroxy-tetrahydrodipicolinate reductase [Aerococcus urinaehominis]SDL91742.1 dihydrodipicolinate reductase [Aerococcus urinaehominis]
MKVIVSGFLGRMGSTSAHMVQNHADFELAGLVDPAIEAGDLADQVAFWSDRAPVFANLETALNQLEADAVVDFSQPQSAFINTKLCLQAGVHPIVGTSGFTDADLAELSKLAKNKQISGIIAPNFAISSVLMQVFAGQAAKYFKDVEIIELHHDQKLDAPSGTAEKTARLIYENRGDHQQGHPEEKESMAGARGANYHGIHIHSVRLPGLNSHQVVQFGAPGEGLTIRQDSYDRESYMHGVALALEKVGQETGLIYGLEHIL